MMALIMAGTNHGIDLPLHVVLIEDIFGYFFGREMRGMGRIA